MFPVANYMRMTAIYIRCMVSKIRLLLVTAGLNVTDAQITTVNGRTVINAQMPTSPAPAPSNPIPISQNSWKNKAILWGKLTRNFERKRFIVQKVSGISYC